MDYTKLSLKELSEASGETPRTIRYYIAEGLLDGPDTMGCNAGYPPEYKERLELIKKLRWQGHSLARIREMLATPNQVEAIIPKEFAAPGPAYVSGSRSGTPPITSTWEETILGGDIKVSIRVDTEPVRKQIVIQALADLAVALDDVDKKENKNA